MSDKTLVETRPSDLIAVGAQRHADRLRRMADDLAGQLMMAESHLVKGEIAQAHEWLVKARYRLAEDAR
jgi:hypothetical protein